MTWGELFVLYAVILLVVVAWRLAVRLRARHEERGMRRRGTHWEYRDYKGGKIAIETSDDNPHQADVIAETLRTGKPIFGQVDQDGKFTMHVIEDED